MTRKTKKQLLPDEAVMNKIYYIRQQRVMLDKDLAELYNVKPRRLREQVKRNMKRFPKNFMFRLTKKEVDLMVSQNAIPSLQHLGGFLPYAFTEHGVLMLANVLRGDTAMQLSVRIIEIFVKMREMLSTHKDILLKLEQLDRKVVDHDKDIYVIFEHLKKLLTPPAEPRERIGFRRKNDSD